MPNQKISNLTPKGSALVATDLLEVSVYNGTTYDTRSVTGANVVSGLQPTLVSGTNIKTINSTSILGSGNIVIGGGGLTVGTTAIASGTIGRILFEGTGNVVQQDSTLFWDNTNKRLGVGATPSASVRLDVRAQGALVTDIAFRVRNSADTADLFQVNGLGQVWSNGKGGINSNTAFGEDIFSSLTSGYLNSAFGRYALQSVNTGYENNAFGYMTLNSLTSGYNNTAIGYQAGRFITTGTFNTAVGAFALQLNTSAFGYNTAVGYASMQDTTGQYNTGLGYQAGKGITTGQFNTYIGFAPATGVTTGNNNVIIGSQIGAIGNVSNTAILADGGGNIAIRKDANHFVGVGYSGIATLGAKLDIKAAGALSTDIAFRVRNSADNANLFQVNGDGSGGWNINGKVVKFGSGSSITTGSGSTSTFLTAFSLYNCELQSPLILNNQILSSAKHVYLISGGYDDDGTKTVALDNGTAPSANRVNTFKMYSADQTAGNAAPHFRTENGAVVKLYQETTAVTSATVVSGSGGVVKHDDTFDGYTLEKIVKALRNQGLLQ